MKQMKFLIMLAALALSSVLASAGQITHTVTYDPDKMSFSDSIKNNDTFTIVEYEGLLSYNDIAHPKLPTDVLTFSVPYNAKNFRVQLYTNSYYEIQLSHTIFPQQQSIPTDGTLVPVFTEPDPVAYSSFSFIPSQTSSILSSGYLLGDNQVVTVRIAPITYNPKYNRIRLATNATLELDYDIDTSIVPPISRFNLDIKEKEMSEIEPYIVNGYYLGLNSYVYTLTNPSAGHQHSLPTYTYCVITSRALEPAFKKIIAMKRQKGLSAGVVCMEDLMASPVCNGGDVIGGSYSTISDSAGVVREYLKYAFQSTSTPTQYVLMGGKSPFAPVRYTNSQMPSHLYSNNKRHVSSDMYFGDLSMPWSYFSSPFDSINQSEYIVPNIDYETKPIPFYPDLFVGRLLCTSQNEIDNYSNKLYNYIFNPGNGNSTYLSRFLVVSSESLNNMANDYLIWANNVFDENMDISHIENTSSNYLTGSQLINHLNSNKCGYLSLYGHGEPQSIELYNNGHDRFVVSALDSYIADTLGLDPGFTTVNEVGNGLDCLNNKYHPFVCYSISCVTMPYSSSPSYNAFTTYENKYNFGESFTLGKNYGGVAFLGNTRYGFTNESNKHEAEFVKTLLDKKMFSLGKAEEYSKMFYKVVKNSCYNHVSLEHNLLGDPEFEMWTSEPQQYTGITISQYNSYIIVDGISASDTIAYCDNDGNVGRTFGANGFNYIVGISPTASIMVYNHDHIPYIAPLKLQNCNINNSQYVYASSFSAGKAIISNITHGNVTIKNSVIYEIEATDDVYLGEGFIVENGATFAIKTPGKVTIDGCVFQSGAKVKIEAGKVEVAGKFTAERGSKVEMTKFVDD